MEPFAGAASVYWALGQPNSHLNDTDTELINFYRVVQSGDQRFVDEVTKVADLFGKTKRTPADRDAQAAAYYAHRNLDRAGGLATLPDWQRAARFFIVNQLAFSGMRRFNSSGEFNIPFGHYKSFNAKVLTSKPHRDLLATTTVTCGGYDKVLPSCDNPNTFIFLDPPYTRVMNTYSAGNPFGEAQQRKLAADLKGLQHASWMLIIDKSELTVELYGDHITHTYPVNYGVNIKNRFDQGAEHILATNYVTATGGTPPFLSGDSG